MIYYSDEEIEKMSDKDLLATHFRLQNTKHQYAGEAEKKIFNSIMRISTEIANRYEQLLAKAPTKERFFDKGDREHHLMQIPDLTEEENSKL
jgi:hypothetical protein